MKIGIPSSSIVRLGGKATPATEPLQLEKQVTSYKMTRAEYAEITGAKGLRETYCTQLEKTFNTYKWAHNQNTQLFKHLKSEDPEYFEAFTIPKAHGGQKLIGGNGKPIHDSYLFDQWTKGRDAGFLSYHENVVKAFTIWSMPFNERRKKLKKWQDAQQKVSQDDLIKKHVNKVHENGKVYNSCLASIERIFGRKTEVILNEKRIIACTTTGAAKHGERIRAASPTVVLVEEAGEILESHVLTALGPRTDQLILIGDHKSVYYHFVSSV